MINKRDTKVITDIADENWGYTEILVEAQNMDRTKLEKKYANNSCLLIKFRRELNELEEVNEELAKQNKKLSEIKTMSGYDEIESYWDLLEKYKKLKADYESEQSFRKNYQKQAWEYKQELQEKEEELNWWINCNTTDFKVKYGADKVIICRDLEEK